MIAVLIQPKTEVILEGPSFSMLQTKLEWYVSQNPNDIVGPLYNENGVWKHKITHFPTPVLLDRL